MLRPRHALPLDPAPDPAGYTPNDASVGDLDGDGEYEIVAAPGRPRPRQLAAGVTDRPILQAYKLDGTLLWRSTSGKNIREGAHYTQFMVYDLDGDGRAEIACKTADGTIDGAGKVDRRRERRPAQRRRLRPRRARSSSPSSTGGPARRSRPRDVHPAAPPEPTRRRPSSSELWGDDYGNRVRPLPRRASRTSTASARALVMCRGYYTRAVLAAWDWRDGKLTQRWIFDSDDGTRGNRAYRGQGNHNFSVADVDGDGEDEIVYGACVIDDDGKGLYSTGLGHGDAMHVSDLDPDQPGPGSVRHPGAIRRRGRATSATRAPAKSLWKKPSVSAPAATARARAAASRSTSTRATPAPKAGPPARGSTGSGTPRATQISEQQPRTCNFGVWWDGDLLRELLDGTTISKWNWTAGAHRRAPRRRPACTSNNGTKATPVLCGRHPRRLARGSRSGATDDGKELRIYTTTIPTDHRFTR